jgi:hypothetical protein
MPLLGDLLGRAVGVEGDFGVATLRDGDDQREADYVDHLHQPGNTKKRKVPAHASGSPQRGHDSGLGAEEEGTGEEKGEDEDDGAGDAGAVAGHNRRETPSTRNGGSASSNTSKSIRRPKMSPAALAGLHHKEMLKSRKRQLAAVLGVLSHGDSLALDQALSANYAAVMGLSGGAKGTKPKMRRVFLSLSQRQ